jgi:transposase
MEHIAIDLGSRESQICVRGGDGRVLEETRWPTRALRRFLEGRPPSRVVVETCSEAFAVADAALELKHEVRVVPATLVRSLGVGSRGIKTDRRDAQVLSEVSCRIDLPSVHIKGVLARRRQVLCNMRDALVTSRTKLVNTIRSWLRTIAGPVLRAGSPETFAARLRKQLPEEEMPRAVLRQLRALEALNAEIAEADADLLASAEKDPDCVRLMTIPGIGPVAATRCVSVVDEVSRFPDAHKFASYVGLSPGEASSSDRIRRTSITKAGAATLRHALVQAAWAARRARGTHPMVQWSLEVEKRRGKRVAIVALARKLAGIMFAILRDGSTYDPIRGAAAV